MEEVAAVAHARGIQLDDNVVTDTMRYVDSLAPNATTSLQRDIAEGKLSEIDYWNRLLYDFNCRGCQGRTFAQRETSKIPRLPFTSRGFPLPRLLLNFYALGS
jgi:hypothetical protein